MDRANDAAKKLHRTRKESFPDETLPEREAQVRRARSTADVNLTVSRPRAGLFFMMTSSRLNPLEGED